MSYYEVKNYTFKAVDISEKDGIVSGYFSSFGNKDSDGDIIERGAFKKTIKERGPKSTKPPGRSGPGGFCRDPPGRCPADSGRSRRRGGYGLAGWVERPLSAYHSDAHPPSTAGRCRPGRQHFPF